MSKEDMKDIAVQKAITLHRTKKEDFLLKMSEDKFRDEVVRPLFLRLNYTDGREMCGPFEQGKDTVFVDVDKLGLKNVLVVQTKKGALTMSRKATQNIIEAVTQLKTALETSVVFLLNKEKKYPTKAILCSSGKINEAAKRHIIDEIRDPRLAFIDSDELINLIDENYPELWFGIETNRIPYFRRIRQMLEVGDIVPSSSSSYAIDALVGAATDEAFVPLNLYRTIIKVRKEKGKIDQIPVFQEIPIASVVDKPMRSILILGEAGTGKSTALKRIAYVLTEQGMQLERECRIPILLRATETAKASTSSLIELCDEWSKIITGSHKSCFSAKDLSAGRVIVMIDALDELPDDNERIKVLNMIRDFHTSYPDCKVIVTSREYAFIKKLSELKPYETFKLSPLSLKEAGKIVDRLQKGKNIPAEKSKEVIRRLQDIHGMELSPLMVTVFAATSDYSKQDIPANITELFKKFTELMLGRWDQSKGLAQQYHAPIKDFLLTKVAFIIHDRKETSIEIEEFNSLVANELTKRGHEADLKMMIDEILYRSGLFRIIGNRIEFRHHLLQEFFAGRGIPSSEYIKAIVSNDWWKRPIVFYFGENPDNAVALDNIIKSLENNSAYDRFSAATTIGMALQASYLAKVADKLMIIRWVMDVLAGSMNKYLEEANEKHQYALSNFIFYYLYGRDSVALSALNQNISKIQEEWLRDKLASPEEQEARNFWLIIGLIEIGAFEEVEKLTKKYHPFDKRFLLAIYLGCHIAKRIRHSSGLQKELADSVCFRLEEKVRELRLQLLKEMKSELLEIRKGEVKAIEDKKD
jgi:hypothetical protein